MRESRRDRGLRAVETLARVRRIDETRALERMSEGRARLVELEGALERLARARTEALERSRPCVEEACLPERRTESERERAGSVIATSEASWPPERSAISTRIRDVVRSVIEERRYAEKLRLRESSEREKLEGLRREWGELRQAFGEARSSLSLIHI